MHRLTTGLAMALALLCGAGRASADFVLDFEGLADQETVTGQFAALGVTFSNAVALRAGEGLNAAVYPPHSGSTVVYLPAGRDPVEMVIAFATPVDGVGGYFNFYNTTTLTAFDATGSVVGTARGIVGTDAFLEVAGAGIRSVRIESGGGYDEFTLDDLTVRTAAVPEPAGLVLLGTGLLAMLARSRRLRRRAA